jgi:asparagine synthase (glutamine-hydrolysing)
MCGIVGLWLRDREVTSVDVNAMNSQIVHRGPDEDGVLVDGNVGLGMRRLSIIDLDGGHQPISNETGRIHVIQNGELYNYQELRKQLQAKGHRFRTQSDTEVAVHAYEEWGGFEFGKHLRGMFSIAVWDADQQSLWLVRDRLGIKPLYFTENAVGIAFGSEVKALLASPIVSHELEPRALEQYLTFGSAGDGNSFIKGVRQLQPGHVVRFSDEQNVIRPYWSFRWPERPLEISEEDAAEELLSRLRKTVRLHLVSDVSVGAFLSGGVDSSAIVALMAQEGAGCFKTFSIGFGEDEFNELPYAKQVADQWKTEHYTQIVRPNDAIEILDDLIFHLDEPFADASAIPMWYVSRLAAQHVKVVLSGDGGDELFAGYDRYSVDLNRAWIDRIPRLVRRTGAAASRLLPEWWPGKYFLDYAAQNMRGRFAYNLHLFPPPLLKRVLRPEWHPESLGVEDSSREMVNLLDQSNANDPLSEFLYLDVLRYLPLDILTKVDRMTMAHSLEARPPLLDHEFVEFAASLPIHLKYSQNGRRKHILKKAVASLLPDGLLDRRKAGFEVPLQKWFAGPLAGMFEDQVLSNGLCSDYLDTKTLRIIFEENRRGRRDYGLQLWAILIFELWLRRSFRPN